MSPKRRHSPNHKVRRIGEKYDEDLFIGSEEEEEVEANEELDNYQDDPEFKLEEEDESDSEYEVERIVDKRIRRGKPQYLVKWLGYPEEDNTWQPVDTMNNCDKLIEEFERSRKQGSPFSSPSKLRLSSATKAQSTLPSKRKRLPPLSQRRLEKGDWEDLVDKVETISREDGVLTVHLRWKNGEETEEAASEVNLRCPQKIIAFYESRLRFPR